MVNTHEKMLNIISHSVQFSSVAQSCPTLCNPMNRSTPGLPVHHQLLEFTQTNSHRVCDAIQPSHPLSSPSPPAPNPSQHQSPFQRVNSSHEVAKVLVFQLYHHSFQRNPRANLLQNGLVGSPCSPRESQESSPTPQFKSINSSALRSPSGKCKSKPQRDITSHLPGWQKQTSNSRTTKNPKTKQRKISSGQDVGKLEPSYFAGGSGKYGTQLGTQLGRPSESSQKYLVTQQSHS